MILSLVSKLGISRAKLGRCAGSTMIQVMVTLAISAILLTLALPSFEGFKRNNLLATSSNELSTLFNRARAEAIKSRRNVRICPTTNNSNCAADGSWAAGWIMFVDTDGDDLPAVSELIQIGAALDNRLDLLVPTAFSNWVQFRPSGSVLGNAGNSGDFGLCSGDFHDFSRRVGISATGRVSAKKQPNLCAPQS